MNVQLFIPCFIDQLYPQVAFNMVKVLEKVGCTVKYNANQTNDFQSHSVGLLKARHKIDTSR
jgi:Fe-S oxidoreductase